MITEESAKLNLVFAKAVNTARSTAGVTAHVLTVRPSEVQSTTIATTVQMIVVNRVENFRIGVRYVAMPGYQVEELPLESCSNEVVDLEVMVGMFVSLC